ncbi:MAG: membrane lipoprotein lipid attachment site-containing protein [Chloroflexota bacterium]
MKRIISTLGLLFLLAGCQSTVPAAPSTTGAPALTPVLSPTLTPTTHPTPTDMPRWQLYEAALLEATIKREDGLCEWTIMGVSGNEVYVYTLCQATGRIKTAMSVPAVIYLGESGEIENVVIPRDGIYYGEDIRALFPKDVQEKIFARDVDGPRRKEHLDDRMINGGPPLIVVLGTPMP